MPTIVIIHFVTLEAVRKVAVPALRMTTRRDWPTRCNAGRESLRAFRASHDRCRKREGRDLMTRRGRKIMARNGTSLEAAHALVKELIAEKLRFLVPMTIVFIVSYIGLTVLAGFAKDLMGVKVVGSVNLGFALIALNYLLSWTLAIVYGRVAAGKFDPLAARAAIEISGLGN
jgi:uncharacterized membrane protein (DUF485 family)